MAEVAAHLADVYYQMGDKDRAFEYLQKGYELNAEDLTLIDTIERLGYTPSEPPASAASVETDSAPQEASSSTTPN